MSSLSRKAPGNDVEIQRMKNLSDRLSRIDNIMYKYLLQEEHYQAKHLSSTLGSLPPPTTPVMDAGFSTQTISIQIFEPSIKQ